MGKRRPSTLSNTTAEAYSTMDKVKPIPRSSLLQKHPENVVYRVTDPLDRTPGVIEFGLFSWDMADRGEGVGLRYEIHKPSRRHMEVNATDYIKEHYSVMSHGRQMDGQTARLHNASAAELRSLCTTISQHLFALWWCEDNDVRIDFALGEMREGGSVHTGGEWVETPYSIETITLRDKSEVDTPLEACYERLETSIKELRDEFPEYALQQAISEARNIDIYTYTDREIKDRKRRKQEREMWSTALNDISLIGRSRRNSLKREFDDIEAICDDIRNGSERLERCIPTGGKTESNLIDGLIANDAWVGEDC